MSFLINPYRYSAAAFNPAVLFGGGETGDLWRFDAANTDANAVSDPITVATGTVNALLLEDFSPATAPALGSTSGREHASFLQLDADRLIHNFGSTIPQPITIIVSMNSTSTGSARNIVTGSSTTLRCQISLDSSNNLVAHAGTTLDSTTNAPIGTKVLAVEFNGASSKFRVNGTQTATGNTGSQGSNQITLGTLWDGTAGHTMQVYSLLFINRLLDPVTELDPVERLMGSHAGISW